MELKFSKMEGLGNDFIVVDDRDLALTNYTDLSKLSEKLCDRHFGIGADGLILVNKSEKNDIKFRIFNSDGSEPEMCGNGIRCFAKFAFDNGIVSKELFEVETLAGTIIPKINKDESGLVNTVRVDMGEPILEAKKVPFISENETAISEEINVDGEKVFVTTVSMGNPHAIIFVDSVKTAPVRTLGPKVETHPKFPRKTNVEFVEIISENEINMRVWERGDGETLACGTGSCATLVASNLNKKAGRRATIHLLGGDLFIEWDEKSNHIFMTGAAKTVFTGTVII